MDNGVPSAHTSQVPAAQGMVCAQVDCTVEEALVLLNTRAQATGLRLEEVAIAVVDHRTEFRHHNRTRPGSSPHHT